MLSLCEIGSRLESSPLQHVKQRAQQVAHKAHSSRSSQSQHMTWDLECECMSSGKEVKIGIKNFCCCWSQRCDDEAEHFMYFFIHSSSYMCTCIIILTLIMAMLIKQSLKRGW